MTDKTQNSIIAISDLKAEAFPLPNRLPCPTGSPAPGSGTGPAGGERVFRYKS